LQLGHHTTGLNSHVRYIHNQFMLIDPLSDDPIVIGGSANSSAASTEDNDENMLVIRGNRRAAGIYLGEFMRLSAITVAP
jgi:phosphatidylserine/phosphatidylglycerophosphate/cardiolipin synthase-like enzyme